VYLDRSLGESTEWLGLWRQGSWISGDKGIYDLDESFGLLVDFSVHSCRPTLEHRPLDCRDRSYHIVLYSACLLILMNPRTLAINQGNSRSRFLYHLGAGFWTRRPSLHLPDRHGRDQNLSHPCCSTLPSFSPELCTRWPYGFFHSTACVYKECSIYYSICGAQTPQVAVKLGCCGTLIYDSKGTPRPHPFLFFVSFQAISSLNLSSNSSPIPQPRDRRCCASKEAIDTPSFVHRLCYLAEHTRVALKGSIDEHSAGAWWVSIIGCSPYALPDVVCLFVLSVLPSKQQRHCIERTRPPPEPAPHYTICAFEERRK
jgi:hypothetical protein